MCTIKCLKEIKGWQISKCLKNVKLHRKLNWWENIWPRKTINQTSHRVVRKGWCLVWKGSLKNNCFLVYRWSVKCIPFLDDLSVPSSNVSPNLADLHGEEIAMFSSPPFHVPPLLRQCMHLWAQGGSSPYMTPNAGMVCVTGIWMRCTRSGCYLCAPLKASAQRPATS